MAAFTESDADDDQDLLCFNAVVDEKGRLLVPAYIRKRLGISRNALVSVVLEKIASIKKYSVESDGDTEKILSSLASVDNIISYRCSSGFLEVTVGSGGSD